MLEYRSVALRPQQLLASRLKAAEMLDAIQEIENNAEPVETTLKLRPLSVDPNDNMIIELAVAASVDAIVTSNKAFQFGHPKVRYPSSDPS